APTMTRSYCDVCVVLAIFSPFSPVATQPRRATPRWPDGPEARPERRRDAISVVFGPRRSGLLRSRRFDERPNGGRPVPLDPIARTVIEQFAAAGPPIGTVPAPEAREASKARRPVIAN